MLRQVSIVSQSISLFSRKTRFNISESLPSRSEYRAYSNVIVEQLKQRKKMKIFEEGADITPKDFGRAFGETLVPTLTSLESIWDTDLQAFEAKILSQDVTFPPNPLEVKIANLYERTGANLDIINIEMEGPLDDFVPMDYGVLVPPSMPQFAKITLHDTGNILLYESNSSVVPQDSPLADKVIKDNEKYEYLMSATGRSRRTSEAETQTKEILLKSRSVNTDKIPKQSVGTFVSIYDMHDTYVKLNKKVDEEEDDDKDQKIIRQLFKLQSDNGSYMDKLGASKNFKLSSMIIQRLLAGNNFRESQRRFRNMVMPDPLDLMVKYTYTLKPLWKFNSIATLGKAVSSFAWCPKNGDILAVGYGVYTWVSFSGKTAGAVEIWNIKNPVNAERRYSYKTPVTAVAFSELKPQLLAVGLYSGTIEILDINDIDYIPVATTERSTSPILEPIWAILWIVPEKCEEILAISQNGDVIKYQMSNGPHLLGFRQMKIVRVDGPIEGLSLNVFQRNRLEANRSSQATALQVHPTKPDIYFVGTDEGCIHYCSTYYPNQHTGIMRVHRDFVISIEFSPFSPKIFMTAGSDHYVRIWITDINEPIIELFCNFQPIRSSKWSPRNSTIIICATNSKIFIWNIRKSIFKAAAIHELPRVSDITGLLFSPCGRSLVIGDNEGGTHMYALDDMPFDPHFQCDELQHAISKALHTRPDVHRQFSTMGYLGYPK